MWGTGHVIEAFWAQPKMCEKARSRSCRGVESRAHSARSSGPGQDFTGVSAMIWYHFSWNWCIHTPWGPLNDILTLLEAPEWPLQCLYAASLQLCSDNPLIPETPVSFHGLTFSEPSPADTSLPPLLKKQMVLSRFFGAWGSIQASGNFLGLILGGKLGKPRKT